MNIQIIGTKKCRETQKAERFFKERRIPYHFRDLSDKGISKGELENISRVVPLDGLINRDSKKYKDRGMQFMVFDIEQELLEDSLLLKIPIVRNERLVTVGYQTDVWKEWLNEWQKKIDFYNQKLKINLIILFDFTLYIKIMDINKKTAILFDQELRL